MANSTLQCQISGGSEISVPGWGFSEFYASGGSNYHTLLIPNRRPGVVLFPQYLHSYPPPAYSALQSTQQGKKGTKVKKFDLSLRFNLVFFCLYHPVSDSNANIKIVIL